MKTFKTWQMQKLIEGTHVMQHVMGRCVLTYIYMYVDRPRYIYVYIHSLMYIWDVHVQMWNHYWKSTTHLDDTVQLSKLKRVVWVGSNKSVGKNFSFASWCVAAPPRRVRVHLPHLCSWALLCISLRIFAVDLCLASFGALLWLAVSDFSGSCSTSGWPFCQLETFIAVLVGFQLVTTPVLSSTPCGAIIQCPFTLSPFCSLQIIFDWPGRRLWF